MNTDLSTTYLGLALRHPIIASASPLTATVDGICALAGAGAAAVVLPSLFEEQVHAEDTAYTMYSEHGSFSQPEAGNYFPELSNYDHGIAGHLDTLRRAVAAVDIPVIASLNGVTTRGWTEYAARLEQAGAAAIELNMKLSSSAKSCAPIEKKVTSSGVPALFTTQSKPSTIE